MRNGLHRGGQGRGGGGVEVSERVAKCNLKKKRTSSHSLARSLSLSPSPSPSPSPSLSLSLSLSFSVADGPRPPSRQRAGKKAKSSVWFTIQPTYSTTRPCCYPYPSLFLIVASSRRRSCTFAHSSPFLFDFALVTRPDSRVTATVRPSICE
jgi:hypothetical protein